MFSVGVKRVYLDRYISTHLSSKSHSFSLSSSFISPHVAAKLFLATKAVDVHMILIVALSTALFGTIPSHAVSTVTVTGAFSAIAALESVETRRTAIVAIRFLRDMMVSSFGPLLKPSCLTEACAAASIFL